MKDRKLQEIFNLLGGRNKEMNNPFFIEGDGFYLLKKEDYEKAKKLKKEVSKLEGTRLYKELEFLFLSIYEKNNEIRRASNPYFASNNYIVNHHCFNRV